jgi:Arc/MetJ-type ribon-helix-helix transcriptional regulator
MLLRTSLTLPEEDVRLLDRLAALDGKNRSEMVRYLLAEMRPRITQLVDILEFALANRDALLTGIGESSMEELQLLIPEVEKIDAQIAGAMSRVEGALTASADQDQDEILMQAFGRAIGKPLPPKPKASNPRRSNHGGQKLTPLDEKEEK